MARLKTCKICKNKFTPTRQLQPTCNNIECMSAYADKHLNKKRIEKAKSRRKAIKQFNDSDINVLKRKAQKVCNEYIRLRDAKEPCISCLYTPADNPDRTPRQWHASHYRPATNSLLRFNEDNIHKSCQICNTHLSGNLANYRLQLIKKIGLEKVEWLEAQNGIYRYTVDELKAIASKFKRKIKKLQKDN